MIKECNVKLNNEVATVVIFDGVEVQLPPIHKDARTVCVNYANGRYSVVDNNHNSKASAVTEKKISKKTTVEKETKEAENTSEDSENA